MPNPESEMPNPESEMPNPESEMPSGPMTIDQEVEDLLADTIDLLLSPTEESDSFSVVRKPDKTDAAIVWFVVYPQAGKSGKAPGIVIGHNGSMAKSLRTIVRNIGLAHGRKFRLAIDTPDGPVPPPRRRATRGRVEKL